MLAKKPSIESQEPSSKVEATQAAIRRLPGIPFVLREDLIYHVNGENK